MSMKTIPSTVEEILATGEMEPEMAKIVKEGPPVNMLAGEVGEMRATADALMESVKGLVEDLVKDINVRDQKIKVRDGQEIEVRIFSPKEPKEGGSPLALLCHGGGFVFGKPTMETGNAAILTGHFGFVCVSVGYRLAPEYPFPTPVNDSYDAMQWAATNADSLGANPQAGFIVGGMSAGASISSALLYMARDNNFSPPLTGALLLCPTTVSEKAVPEKYKPFYLSMEQNVNAPVINTEGIRTAYKHYKPDHQSVLFSTLNDPKGHQGLPPVYLKACGLDPLRDDALIYEKELREAGVKTKMDVYPGLPHIYWGVYLTHSKTMSAAEDTAAAIIWLLQGGQGP